MISFETITKCFDAISGKGLDLFKSIVAEVDKNRLIDYGEKRVEVENFRKVDELCDRGLSVRRAAEQRIREHGLPEHDKYKRG